MDLLLNTHDNTCRDSHKCGDCGTEFNTIEDFVHHKIHIEKLKLQFVPSLKIKDLLIPTFMKENIEIKEATEEDVSKITIDSEDQLQCETCRKIFTEDFILQIHKKQFDDKSLKSGKNCDFCGANFDAIKTIRRRFENEYDCNYKNCNYTFKTKGSLKRHERRHTGERPYNCELCGRNFTESGALKRHKKSRILCTNKSDSDLPRYGKRMEDNKLGNIIDGTDNAVLDDLDNDLNDSVNPKIVENIKEKFQVCDICDASFETVKDLRNHLLRHTGKQYIKCGVCKFVSYEKEDIIEHIEKFHREFNNQSPHEVEMNLIIHQIANDKPEEVVQTNNTIQCNVCDQTFETDDDLKIHLLNHSALKAIKEHYICLVCNKEFMTKSKFRKHALSHSDQRNFRCSECGKLFKRISHAKEHIKNTHSNHRPHLCIICNKQFKTISSMKTHMKIHEDDLQFSCHLCEKRFREKASLQRHLRIHTGEKPYICRYCGHGFAEHGTLNRHLKAKMPCYLQSINQLQNEDLNQQQLLIHTFQNSNQEENLVDINLSCEPFSDPRINSSTNDF